MRSFFINSLDNYRTCLEATAAQDVSGYFCGLRYSAIMPHKKTRGLIQIIHDDLTLIAFYSHRCTAQLPLLVWATGFCGAAAIIAYRNDSKTLFP